MAGVSVTGVTKRFGDATALADIDLTVSDGAFVAILGPSGCGKTTLLRLLAGFERPDGGTIAIGGEIVSAPGLHLPAERRRLGMVFQSYALWPHMDVAANVGYSLKAAGVGGAERADAVAGALKAVGMEALAERRPQDLSGGQRQRVALARCLAQEPRLVLLDEPLANLDVHLRDQMQAEFAAFHAKTGATMIYVTHDQAEALALADMVVVLDRGRIQQVASPRRLYSEPATPMVAEFIGRGMIVPVERIQTDGGGAAIGLLWGHPAPLDGHDGSAVSGVACLRAEDIGLTRAGDGLPARVRRTVFQGDRTLVELSPTAASEVLLRAYAKGEPPSPGDHCGLEIGRLWLIPDRLAGQKLGGVQAETISASSSPTLRKRWGRRLLK